MPGSHRDAGGGVLRGAGVAAEPVQRRDQPLAQPRRRPAATHVYREVKQPRCSVDVPVVPQHLIHGTRTLAGGALGGES